MSLRESWQRFARWSGDNKLKSFALIIGSIYVLTLPFVRRTPLTAQERAKQYDRT